MKATVAWMTAIAGAALVIAGGMARRSVPPPNEPPKSFRPLPVADARQEDPAPLPRTSPGTEVSPASREAQPDESEFWSGVEILLETKRGPGGTELRRAVIERTLRYLGWADSRRLAFASAAEVAAQEAETAWSVREAQQADLGAGEAVHARYEDCKRMALARIDLLLDPSRDPERRLRDRLEEWFDAIR